MDRDNPVDNISDLINYMLMGVNPIYVKSKYYMKKYNNLKTDNCGTIFAEVIQIAYAYGCDFIEVEDDKI